MSDSNTNAVSISDVWDGITERRSGHDPRKGGWKSIRNLFYYRRRRLVRRAEDRRRIVFLDYYSGAILISAVVVLLLSLTDGFLTLFLLSHGAVEMNPVMAYFLQFGAEAFLIAKYVLTAIPVLIVAILNYTFIRRLNIFTRSLFKYFAVGFAAVIAWELILVAHVVL